MTNQKHGFTIEGIAAKTADRRSVIKAAAWAAPVVAVAASAPLAAASAASAVIAAGASGDILASEANGTASGELTGRLEITNVINGPWDTGALMVEYSGTGNWTTFSMTDVNGNPIVQGSTVVSGGLSWLVSFVETDAAGTWTIRFEAPSQSVSSATTYTMPLVQFSGEFIPGTATKRNPLGATVRVSAANVNNGNTVANSVSYP